MSETMQAFWFGLLLGSALTLIGVSVASANRKDDRCATCRATDYLVDCHPAPMDFEDVLRLHGSEGPDLPREVDAQLGIERGEAALRSGAGDIGKQREAAYWAAHRKAGETAFAAHALLRDGMPPNVTGAPTVNV